jgi:hypothetical protein
MLVFATHLIKVKGYFDKQKWAEDKLRGYVYRKIQEINPYYHPDLELLRVEDDAVEVWVYIRDVCKMETVKEYTQEWLQSHIKEDGIDVKDFEVKEIMSYSDFLCGKKPKFFVEIS